MPVILIREEELYPEYVIGDEGYPIELTDWEKESITEIINNYKEAQEVLKEKFQEAKKGKYSYEKR